MPPFSKKPAKKIKHRVVDPAEFDRRGKKERITDRNPPIIEDPERIVAKKFPGIGRKFAQQLVLIVSHPHLNNTERLSYTVEVLEAALAKAKETKKGVIRTLLAQERNKLRAKLLAGEHTRREQDL